MKSIYRHKTSDDLFAIETDDKGNVLSTCGPLLFKDLDPKLLDYDDYWNTEIAAKLNDFVRLNRTDYRELLTQNGFVIQFNQKHLF
jgi:hypothetical protein